MSHILVNGLKYPLSFDLDWDSHCVAQFDTIAPVCVSCGEPMTDDPGRAVRFLNQSNGSSVVVCECDAKYVIHEMED